VSPTDGFNVDVAFDKETPSPPSCSTLSLMFFNSSSFKRHKMGSYCTLWLTISLARFSNMLTIPSLLSRLFRNMWPISKKVLDDFTAATGLAINFHKSTFIPIKTSPTTTAEIADTFGCAISSFSQTYLGLLLSTHKLRLADFAPIVSKSDMRLSG
jgi:hypothetical protein